MSKTGWVALVILGCVVWLAMMVGASYWGYLHKDPVRMVRIEQGATDLASKLFVRGRVRTGRDTIVSIHRPSNYCGAPAYRGALPSSPSLGYLVIVT